jgi:acetylornithine deacetylase/succinyl-diaminopimelate desuccinylase-like protein
MLPEDQVTDLCAALIRFDTTNFGDGKSAGERPAAEFVAAELSAAGYEPQLLEKAPGRTNVVARIPGTDPSAEAVLVHAHLDVVPADASEWSVPPFSGEVRDGFIWGRGAVDMKDMAAMTLAAVRSWPDRGVRPKRDIVVAFVADEEDDGVFGARFLAEQHPRLFDGCVIGISESGGWTYHVSTDSGDTRLYPIACAERGTLHMRVTARGRAGHGSRPNPENAVVTLVQALSRVAAYRWPVHLTPTVRAYLERVGAALGVEVDLSSDESVDATIERLGRAGELVTATVRNTSTPTVLEAGYKVNVIPGTATAKIDVRALPGTEEETLATIDRLLGPGIEREQLIVNQGVSSPFDTSWFEAMGDALRAEDPEAVVVPYCMGGGTDAKAFSALGIDGYGFSPLGFPVGYNHRGMAHGVDERVPVEAVRFGARVLDRFLLS